MKKLLVLLGIIVLVSACKKREGCKDTYTISGKLFHNQNGVFEKDEPMKNWEVSFNVSIPRNFTINKAEFLGTVYTDDNGYFSFTYTCREYAERVGMSIAKSGNIIPGTSYYLPPNQNIHRDFTETSHARIVCEIDNHSDLDTIYISGISDNFIDSGNVEGISKGHPHHKAIPVKGKKNIHFVYVRALDNKLVDVLGNGLREREITVRYGVSYEALDNQDYLGTVSIQCQGAPYYDTVRIELK